MPEPLTSILIRELTILGRDFGRASRGCWEISRALRQALQPDVTYARMAPNKGQSGAEKSAVSDSAPLLPYPEFGSGSEEDYD